MHFVHFLFAINRQWVVETKNKKFIKQLLIFLFIVNADQYMLRSRSLLSQHTLWIMQKKWKKKTFFISLHCYIGLYINSTIHVRAVNSALLIDAAVHCIVSEVINLLRINWNWFIHFICGVYLLFVRLADWQVNRFWNGFAGRVEASRASSRYISAMCTIHGQYHSKYLEYHSASIEFGSYNKEFVLSTLKKKCLSWVTWPKRNALDPLLASMACAKWYRISMARVCNQMFISRYDVHKSCDKTNVSVIQVERAIGVRYITAKYSIFVCNGRWKQLYFDLVMCIINFR